MTSVAVRDGRIVHVSGERDALDDAAPGAAEVIDRPGVVLPGFVDTHNHLMFAARNRLGVPVATASGLGELVRRISVRAASTGDGGWVVTGGDWHELALPERRLPTRTELDAAADGHPVLVQRGGHVGMLNTAALRAAGLAPGAEGAELDEHGALTGRVEDAALHAVQALLPEPDQDALATALAETSRQYAATGLVAVRDPAVSPAEWRAYRRAHADGRLAVRSRAMIFTAPPAIGRAGSVTGYLDDLEWQGIRPGAGDAMLDVWGLKVGLDGGVEGAALSADYLDRPGYRGELLWDRDALAELCAVAAARGWPVGVHAFGDRAIATIAGVLTDLAAERDLPRGGFVVEHGGLITAEQRRTLARLGVPVTVQQALLDGLAPALTAAWGPERTAALFPWRELLDDRVDISAGTDHPIGPLSPLRAIHGMTTRGTPSGVLGPEHAITRAEAIRLYTRAGAPLLGGGLTGTLTPGAPADLAVYPVDPATCPPEELPGLTPSDTVVNGRHWTAAD
ncbi:MAG TPA: amidohydrolase family protein [Streptosporangiaceae bacterium]